MLEMKMTANLGGAPVKHGRYAKASVCCSMQIHMEDGTSPFWIDIQTAKPGLADQLMGLNRGDGVAISGPVRAHNYERHGKLKRGFIMDIQQLETTYKRGEKK
ncbi:MAG: hypothetical protein ACR2PH_16510 [Desulfobulbia bacterium]